MQQVVSLIAPRSGLGFLVKTVTLVVLCNLFAILVVHSVHGYLPSGLRGQVIETTVIALPFAVGSLKVIAYLFELQTRLARLAHTDALTGLPNRRAFLDALDLHLATAGRGHLFLADADHFKQVNDRFGHEGGDICLRAIADHLRAIAGPRDIVARFGGEEFALLLSGSDDEHATQVGALLIVPIPFAPPVREGGGRAVVTLSAGGVPLCLAADVQDALTGADRNLYLAKANGRARFEISDRMLDGDPVRDKSGTAA